MREKCDLDTSLVPFILLYFNKNYLSSHIVSEYKIMQLLPISRKFQCCTLCKISRNEKFKTVCIAAQ